MNKAHGVDQGCRERAACHDPRRDDKSVAWQPKHHARQGRRDPHSLAGNPKARTSVGRQRHARPAAAYRTRTKTPKPGQSGATASYRWPRSCPAGPRKGEDQAENGAEREEFQKQLDLFATNFGRVAGCGEARDMDVGQHPTRASADCTKRAPAW